MEGTVKKESAFTFLSDEITRLKSTKAKWLAFENMGQDKFSELGWKNIISMINTIYRKIALTEQLLNNLGRGPISPLKEEKDNIMSKLPNAFREFYESEARLETSIKINMVNKLKGGIK